jgi:CrcB protein
MWRAVLVGVGGSVGSIARYWIAGFVQNIADSDFPAGTLAVNVVGSLLLGLIVSASLDRGLIGPETRLLLTVGFCGGFTTMSTFSYESVALLEQGAVGLALWNVILNLFVCLGAVWAGLAVARML